MGSSLEIPHVNCRISIKHTIHKKAESSIQKYLISGWSKLKKLKIALDINE
jgi:hypothetical protein